MLDIIQVNRRFERETPDFAASEVAFLFRCFFPSNRVFIRLYSCYFKTHNIYKKSLTRYSLNAMPPRVFERDVIFLFTLRNGAGWGVVLIR